MGHSWLEGIHPEDGDRAFRVFHEAFCWRLPFEMHYRVRRRDGEYRWIMDRAKPFLDSQGNFGGYIGVCYDITDQRRMDMKLKDTSAMMKVILDNFPDVVWIMDKDFHCIQCNKAGENYFHCPSEEAQGQKCYRLLGNEGPCEGCPALEAKKIKEPVKREKRHEASDRWIEIRACPVLDEKGEVVRMVCHVRDISDFRRIEGELRKNKAFLESIFNSIQDGIAVINRDMEITYMNKAMGELYSYSSSAAGRKCYEVFKDCTQPCEDCPCIRSLEQGTMQRKLMRQVDGRGRERWHEVYAHPILDHDGSAIGAVKYVRDVTERKRMGDQIRKSNAILRAQQEAGIDAIFIVEEEEQRVVCNRRALELLDYPGEPGIPLKSDELLKVALERVENPSILLERVERLHKNALESFRDELRLKDGRIFDQYVGAALSSEGQYYGQVWFLREITEQKRFERVLQETLEEKNRHLEEVVEYDKLKTEFFSNISHELKTPLNIILGTLQLMSLYQKQGANIDAHVKVERYIGMMRQNCYRLLRLINNLIDITRIDSGFYKIRPEKTNIVELVENITLSVAAFTEDRFIRLVFDTDVEEKIVACDPDKIERVILNLLSNSIKFTRPGGEIHVNIQDLDDYIQIVVRDTGVGIPKDKLGIIFERFRQVNSSLTRDHEGSGIGLSLVKSLVEMHGGEIAVKSEYGEGTEFSIKLPVEQPEDGKETGGFQRERTAGIQEHVERIHIEFSDIYSYPGAAS